MRSNKGKVGKAIVVLFVFVSLNLGAQTSEYIRSGRPGNASGPFSTGKGIFQIENGTYLYSGSDNIRLTGNSFYMRYGVEERLEFNLITDLSKYSAAEKIEYGGFNLGIKYNWLDNFRNKFSFGTILSHDFNDILYDRSSATALNNIFGYQITNKASVCLNSKLIYHSKSETLGNWLILNAGRSIGSKRNFIYSEISILTQKEPVLYLRTGWYKQFSENFQIDASFRLDQVAPNGDREFFVGGSVGFAYRMMKKN